MVHEKEIIKELLSVIEILQQFYEPPEETAQQFLSWISHVSNTLEVAEMDKELRIWQKAIERVNFVADESSLPVQMSSLKTVLLGMQKKSDNLNNKDVVTIAEPFIANERISELSKITSENYDLSKLVELCKELNYAYAGGCYLSVAMLMRAIIDHIPPIFEKKNFSEVANSYKSSQSFKKSMQYFNSSLRNIADAFLHTQIRNSETLPTKNQVNFSADLDVLLSEIARVLK